MKLVQHSYEDSCIFLLKDVTELVQEITVEEKEALINQGVNYSEMISKEERPSSTIQSLFLTLLDMKKAELANYIAKLSEQMLAYRGHNLVVVSLARAGTPFGILVKRYLKDQYNLEVPHYSLSIIRGKGIDEVALSYIIAHHPTATIQFIDGWTGKGSIIKELRLSIAKFNQTYGTTLDDELAVLADPAKRCRIYGTRRDINIPNCCLNATVSGLISRTIHNEQVILPGEFHGAKTLHRLSDVDVSQCFVDEISTQFEIGSLSGLPSFEPVQLEYAEQVVTQVQTDYQVTNRHKIKLSIGEATRVLLRRQAKVLLLKNQQNQDVAHLIQLAKEKQVPIQTYVAGDYEAIAIID